VRNVLCGAPTHIDSPSLPLSLSLSFGVYVSETNETNHSAVTMRRAIDSRENPQGKERPRSMARLWRELNV
jgi:hypothetical protein